MPLPPSATESISPSNGISRRAVSHSFFIDSSDRQLDLDLWRRAPTRCCGAGDPGGHFPTEAVDPSRPDMSLRAHPRPSGEAIRIPRLWAGDDSPTLRVPAPSWLCTPVRRRWPPREGCAHTTSRGSWRVQAMTSAPLTDYFTVSTRADDSNARDAHEPPEDDFGRRGSCTCPGSPPGCSEIRSTSR